MTGKSTSGGALIGSHFLKGWARTQNHGTTSSAEAELVALVKCSAELLGARSRMRDLGVEKGGVVYGDSSAAPAISNRKGAGKLGHINTSCLWIQEMQGTNQLELHKVFGTENPADMMTKHLPRLSLDKCMRQLNQHHSQGRAQAGLDVQGMGVGRADPTTSPDAPGPNNHKLENPTTGKPGAKTSSSQKSPSTGKPGIRLNSLRVCTTGSSHATYDTHEVTSVGLASGPCGRRDEQSGPSIIFQGGRQGHKRPGVENIDASWESTCPPIGGAVGGV